MLLIQQRRFYFALHLRILYCLQKGENVIKKLDKLIIKAFVSPFFATFFISLFVLVMQFFWLYIDDLVGKGLDVITIFKLIGYVSATLVPLALPLALLLSSIMTFGNMGESFELVAIKSAGISLSRFMRPLFILAVLIAGIAFFFSNNLIPVANLKLNRLKYDIIVTKPALDIKEGVFYDKIPGFVIKIGKKEKDDSTIRNVIIYEKNYQLQDNIIVADHGVMRSSGKFLEFILYNGTRYQERGERLSTNTEYIRMGFGEYKKIFDLSSFEMRNTDDTLFQSDAKMMSVRQIKEGIDSMNGLQHKYFDRFERDAKTYLPFFGVAIDSIQPVKTTAKRFDELIPFVKRADINSRVIQQLTAIKPLTELMINQRQDKQASITRFEIEWNRKYTLSVACIVLFMIGAPLGSIIRKGGLGTPLVFAIIFFVLFHLLNTFGEKFAKEQVTSAFVGMWLSTLVLIPIGVFLTVKAMRDSQLFNQEFYFRFFRAVRKLLPLKAK